MTLSLDLKRIGDRCREQFDVRMPKGEKIKTLQNVLALSHSSAEQIAAGRTPTINHLAVLTRRFGVEFLLYAFRDIIAEGSMEAREERVAGLLRAIHADRGKESDAKVHLRGDAALVDRGFRVAGQSKPCTPRGTTAGLISDRLSLDEISRFPSLVEQLNRFRERLGRMEISEVVAMARAEPNGRSGVVTHQVGDDFRFAYRQRAATLIPQSTPIIGKPITEGSPAAYSALIEHTCREAEASSTPVLARLHGAVRRADGFFAITDVVVLRTVFRSKRRESSIVSTFVPIPA